MTASNCGHVPHELAAASSNSHYMHMKFLILVGRVAYVKSLTFVIPAFSNHSLHHVYDRKSGVRVGACAAFYALNIHQIVHTAMYVGLTALGLIAGAEWILNESGCY